MIPCVMQSCSSDDLNAVQVEEGKLCLPPIPESEATVVVQWTQGTQAETMATATAPNVDSPGTTGRVETNEPNNESPGTTGRVDTTELNPGSTGLQQFYPQTPSTATKLSTVATLATQLSSSKTTTADPEHSSKGGGGGLSTGASAGIGVAVAFGVLGAVAFAVTFYMLRRRKAAKAQKTPGTGVEAEEEKGKPPSPDKGNVAPSTQELPDSQVHSSPVSYMNTDPSAYPPPPNQGVPEMYGWSRPQELSNGGEPRVRSIHELHGQTRPQELWHS